MTNYSKVIKEFDKLYGNSNNTCFSEDYDIKSSDFYEEIIIFIKQALLDMSKSIVPEKYHGGFKGTENYIKGFNDCIKEFNQNIKEYINKLK